MCSRATVLLIVGSLWGDAAVAGGEVAIFPVSGKNLTSEETETIGVLFAKTYGRVANQQVLLPEETAAVVKAAGNLHAAALALAVFEYVDIVATKKAGKLSLTAALFSNAGKMQHRVEMTALSLEDYRQLVGRFAVALFKRQSFADTPSAASPALPSDAGEKKLHHREHAVDKPSGGEVAVFPVQSTNLDAGAAAAMGEVFARAYRRVSGQQVLSPSQIAAVYKMSGSQPHTARVLAVAEYVSIRAVRLASKTEIEATLYRNDGAVAHAAQMTSYGLDDFPGVAQRLAQALFLRLTPEEAMTHQSVVSAETMPKKRRRLEWIIGAKLQVSAILALGAAFDPTATGLFTIRFEAERYFIEAAAGVLAPTSTWQPGNLTVHQYYALVSELGLSWYFLDLPGISLYGGGGVIPRAMAGEGLDFGIRIALYGQVGAMFFRESSVRLYTDLRVAQNVLPFMYFNWEKNEPREFYPTELTLSVGFGF